MSQLRKIFFTEIILLIWTFFHFFLLRTSNSIFLAIELVIIAIIMHFIFNVDRREERTEKDLLLLILIVTLAYYVFTYFIGFFAGFVYSNYSRSLLGIIRNVTISCITIISIENIREKIIKNAKYYKSLIILSILVFAMLEITTQLTLKNIHSRIELVQFIMAIVIPYFSKNIFLTFSTYYTNKKNSIIYSIIMTLPNFILPVFPDLGDYINTLLLTAIPIVILALAYKMFFFKREKITNSKEHKKNSNIQKVFSIILLIILGCIVYLVSNFGRFYALAIGSGSMTGTINKGDVIIIDKKKKEYKKNDIIAFTQNGEIIVHRIIKVNKKENKKFYKTKGDANNGEDAWEVDEKDIVGQKKLRIPFLGLPTVALSELIKKWYLERRLADDK